MRDRRDEHLNANYGENTITRGDKTNRGRKRTNEILKTARNFFGRVSLRLVNSANVNQSSNTNRLRQATRSGKKEREEEGSEAEATCQKVKKTTALMQSSLGTGLIFSSAN